MNEQDNNMKMVQEKIVGHSKLKLGTFLWGHGEHKWSLLTIPVVNL